MEDIRSQLLAFPFFDRLTSQEQDFLAEHAFSRRYDSGKIIQGSEDACLGVIRILSGSIRVFLVSEEGKELTLFRLEKGDFCVLSASCMIDKVAFDPQMSVEETCELIALHSAAFDRLVQENIYARCFLYELMAGRFSQVVLAMQQLLFRSMSHRLAAFLTAESRKSGSSEIRMTQEQIALRINSAREVVARTLKKFSDSGWIRLKRGSVLLLAPEKLEALAPRSSAD